MGTAQKQQLGTLKIQASKMTYIRKCGDTRVNRWLQSLKAQVPEALANRGTGSRGLLQPLFCLLNILKVKQKILH